MLEVYQSHLYFANCLISFIVTIELATNFKKPISLKLMLLGFIGSIFIHNLSAFFSWNVLAKELSRTLIILSGIHIIYLLYDFKLNKNLIALTLLSLVLTTFNVYTFQFVSPEKHDFLFWLRRGIRIINTLGILTIFVIFYLKMIKSLDSKNLYSKKINKWIKITIIIATIAIMNNLSFILIPSISNFSKIISSIIHLSCCLLVIYRPSFLNRTELSMSLGKFFRKTQEDEVNADDFIKAFFTNTYYINKETSIEDLALQLKVSGKKLNEFIYETTKMNFVDLVNKSRIEYFINLVSDELYQDYSLEGLSEMSGFGSRQSLYRNFKKFHGGNPSDLIRLHGKS